MFGLRLDQPLATRYRVGRSYVVAGRVELGGAHKRVRIRLGARDFFGEIGADRRFSVVIEPRAGVGELLRFDNLRYRHGVPDAGFRSPEDRRGTPARWIRYAIGWRAFEQDCLAWADDGPMRRVSLDEAVELEDRFLSDEWPDQVEETLARGHFPFRSLCV